MIKEYFADYFLHTSDITFDLSTNQMQVHNNYAEPWKVTLVDTGLNTMTGGRIKRVQKYIGNEPFLLTYGDGVSNVDIDKLVEFHQSHGKIATMTAISTRQRFGVLDLDASHQVHSFREKTKDDGEIINGGFMVMQPEIFDYLEGDSTVFEKKPLATLADEGQLMAFTHKGFWQCMDTQRDKKLLEDMWSENQAPWKVWE